MSRYHSYIATAVKLLQLYNGKEPFANYIKKYFAEHKKHGSADRKNISALCFGYLRVAHAFEGIQIEKVLIFSEYLLQNSSPLLAALDPGLNETILLSTDEKFDRLGKKIQDIFPGIPSLSSSIDVSLFCSSLLHQADVFLRVRPGKRSNVLAALSANNIQCKPEGINGLRLKIAVKLEGIVKLNYEAVVQDISSQHTLDFIDQLPVPGLCDAWDCCAASGGKALLLYDKLNGRVRLTLSDIRDSILVNLKRRLGEARVPVMKIFKADLATSQPEAEFDIVICDAPCTGSGTWSRMPEQIYFYKKGMVKEYALMQKRIVSNAIPSLKQNGVFCYITCSVFENENEEVAEYIQSLGMKLLQQQYHKGYERKADTLYSAFFSR